MKVAVQKEQLKAVVRLAMISMLEEDVYGTPDPGTVSDIFHPYTNCPRHDFVRFDSPANKRKTLNP